MFRLLSIPIFSYPNQLHYKDTETASHHYYSWPIPDLSVTYTFITLSECMQSPVRSEIILTSDTVAYINLAHASINWMHRLRITLNMYWDTVAPVNEGGRSGCGWNIRCPLRTLTEAVALQAKGGSKAWKNTHTRLQNYSHVLQKQAHKHTHID